MGSSCTQGRVIGSYEGVWCGCVGTGFPSPLERSREGLFIYLLCLQSFKKMRNWWILVHLCASIKFTVLSLQMQEILSLSCVPHWNGKQRMSDKAVKFYDVPTVEHVGA